MLYLFPAKTEISYLLLSYIGIFYPSGEPISPHRLRCSPIAVYRYSSWATALPLQQSWHVN